MRVLTVVLVGALAVGACGGEGDRNEVLVSAAASLGDAFAEIAEAFEAANPGVHVSLNVAGSIILRDQILEGAPVDVFAPADLATMDVLHTAAAIAGEPSVFAQNRLQIAVPAGNPAGITGLGDFADEALLIGLCADGVPCGVFARQALSAAGVDASIDTNEASVRALLLKIEAGELDAGITYVTDVLAGGEAVDGVEIPPDVNVVADYPIAVLADAPHPEAAAAFVAFVRSDTGRAILAEHGFETP